MVQHLIVTLSLLLLSACGSVSPGSVTVEGMVYSDHRVDLPCEEQAALPTRPEELSEIVLRFSDQTASPLAEATTGLLEWEELDHGCRFLARYRVTLPKAEVYRVEFYPPPPRELDGSYFEGAEVLEPQEISLAELEAAGRRWNFEAPPSYVVP